MEKLTPAQKQLYDWLVQYIRTTQYAPSIRQMMEAMNLRSPAPVQSRLDHLRKKGYIDWADGKARTIRILQSSALRSIDILGVISDDGVVEFINQEIEETTESFNIDNMFQKSNYFVLRMSGDSLIEDHITDGDLVIVRPLEKDEKIKNGQMVVAKVEGSGSTLTHFYCWENWIILNPSNSKYEPLKLPKNQVEIQGILVGVWRGYL